MGTQDGALEARLRRVEDRLELRELVELYGFVMDERDLVGLPRLFTPDAQLTSADGVFAAHGLGEIADAYAGRYAVLGATNHFVHAHVLTFEEASRMHDGVAPGRASGVVSGHAEVVRNSVAHIVALRYADTYRRTDEGWRIASREMSYMYYLPVDTYAAVLPHEDRVLVYGDSRPGEWPSVLHSGDLTWLRRHYPEEK